jgi:peptidoglycan hydrolase-like amidase
VFHRHLLPHCIRATSRERRADRRQRDERQPNIERSRRRTGPRTARVTAILLLLSSVVGVAAALAGPASVAAAYPSSTVNLIGHGWGHGIGMGQWGSLGYAVGQDGGAGNFNYAQILGHYYGGTTLTQTNDATSMHDGNVIVAMTEVDGGDTIVTGAGGAAVDFPGGSAAAVLFRQLSPGTFEVYTGASCAGPTWTPVGTASNPVASAAGGGPVNLCTATGTIEVHGTLRAVTNSAGQSRTVNTVPIELYVADVAPAESPSSWASLGGAGPQFRPWGFQQSEAQTVAARSYVEASPLGYGGYADTCDQFCQTYPGMKWETATSLQAATEAWPYGTAGQVMMINGTNTVATTQYSASSGGYTTGDQFPAVPDAGDAICIPGACNPNHDWTASVPVSSIQGAYPQIGILTSVTVTARNGLGDLGGRVEQVRVAGTSGTATDTGDGFASKLGLKSDWFAVSGQPNGGVGGYWLDASDGGVFSFGNALFYGSMGGTHLNQPIVGMAATHDSGGYWEVAADGGVFSFGDAQFHGSVPGVLAPGQSLNRPVVGMATTPDGGGYWMVASDGGVFCFGDAPFEGSVPGVLQPGQSLNKPIVSIVPTRDGRGYWLVASDGGVFAFGDAGFVGSLGSSPPATPIVGVAPTPDNRGYWLLEADGVPHAFGDAPVVGTNGASPGLGSRSSAMTALVADATGGGFDAVDGSGQVFTYGDAPYFGDVASTVNGYTGHVVGIADRPN